MQWIEPNGNLYTTNTFTQLVTGGSYCYNYYIDIYSIPGTWSVQLIWNSTKIFTTQFMVAAPAPPIIVNTQVVQVLVQETCPTARRAARLTSK